MGSVFKALSNKNGVDQLFMQRGGKIHTLFNKGKWFTMDSIQGANCSILDLENNMDGRIEIFVIGDNSKIYHNRQKYDSSYYEWEGWKEMPGNGSAKQIVALRSVDGRLEVFVIGTDNKIYHQWQRYPNSIDEWSGWKELKGNGLAKDLVVEKNEDGRLEVFCIGTDNAVYHNWQVSTKVVESVLHTDATAIGPWEKFKILEQGGGFFTIQTIDSHYLTAVNEGGRNSDVLHTDAIAIGPWEKFKIVDAGNGWSTIQTIDGHFLTAVCGGGRTSDVFHSDATAAGPWEKFKILDQGGDWHTIQTVDGHYVTAANGGGLTSDLQNLWSGWYPLGGSAKQLIATHNQDGRLEAFHIGGNKGIYHRWQEKPNSPFNSSWIRLGETDNVARFISSGINKDGRIEIVTVGEDKRIYHFYQTAPNNGWSAEDRLGGFFNYAKQLTVVKQADVNLIVYTIGTNDNIYCFRQKTTGGWSGEEGLGSPYSDSGNTTPVTGPNPQRVILTPKFTEPASTGASSIYYTGLSTTPYGVKRAVITSIQNVGEHPFYMNFTPLKFKNTELKTWTHNGTLLPGEYVDAGKLPINMSIWGTWEGESDPSYNGLSPIILKLEIGWKEQ